ncbi:LemA family protein [Pseudomonas sp. OV226]|uniref:LemA family protein n=1 Tax=Pseudomonas sp. OV226 TaxID=2135588 RepID=UPI000D7AAB27|nr:LemA family protein [Pseudomonas sp. OV226]PWK30259.1 LemA protein [Pseudomonas sp. OV226]
MTVLLRDKHEHRVGIDWWLFAQVVMANITVVLLVVRTKIFNLRRHRDKSGDSMQGLIIWGMVSVVVLLIAGVIWGYNRLVFNRIRVAAAWSDIDVQLKRRSSLIPQLVECLKFYAAYESATLTALTVQRNVAQQHQASNAVERGEVEEALSNTLKQVFARAEAYPELQANGLFLDLQKNLSDVEDRIQMARRYYNGAVRELNILVESVPTNLLAYAFAFTRVAYFTLDDAGQAEPPKMEF